MFYKAAPTPAPIPRNPGVDNALVDRLANGFFSRAVRYFGGELHDAHRIPESGALIVSNHAFLAIDSTVMVPLIYRETGRLPRGLVEKLLFKVPRIGRALNRVGAVEGTRENAIRLLRSGELCLCYPGGAEESLKGPQNRYKLLWEKTRGYLRVAARAGVPIVPVMGVGVDEAYPSIAREHFFARRIMGKARYDLPVVLGLGPMPLPAKFDFFVGEAFTPDPDLLEDDEALDAAHAEFWGSTQRFLDTKVRQRAGQNSPLSRLLDLAPAS